MHCGSHLSSLKLIIEHSAPVPELGLWCQLAPMVRMAFALHVLAGCGMTFLSMAYSRIYIDTVMYTPSGV